MLAHEGFDQLSLGWEGPVLARADFREDRPVAQVPAAPHHCEVDGGRAVANGGRGYVGVDVAARGFNRLLVAHLCERGNAVAKLCRLFKLPGFRRRPHAFFELIQYFAGMS